MMLWLGFAILVALLAVLVMLVLIWIRLDIILGYTEGTWFSFINTDIDDDDDPDPGEEAPVEQPRSNVRAFGRKAA